MEINTPIRLIELFGGIGSQAMALRDIGADFETYKLVEFDKYAVQSYNAIHGTHFETTDIRAVHGADLEIKDRDKYTYLMTYSFPFTDLSIAGKMAGMSKDAWKNGETTRSGLLWEVERILKELPDDQLPQVLLMENVPQVHADKNLADFDNWLEFLNSRGYINFWNDLNAKDYGMPQNRDRCFCVSVLTEEFIDFQFPEKIPLETKMKDYLEEKVDERYYINTEKAEKLICQLVDDGVLPKTEKDTVDLPAKGLSEISISNCIESRYNKGIANRKNEVSGVIEKTPILISKQATKFDKTTDVAHCLRARDYKGLDNQSCNGIVEVCCKLDKMPDGKLTSMENAKNCDVGTPTASTITARYYKGIGAHKDNMVIEAKK